MKKSNAIEVLEMLFSDSTNEDYPFTEDFCEALRIAIEELRKSVSLEKERLA